ncbi:MarR family winged helix-turn-helix transcriptional regulator [Dictyobacter arantiisoli]|uniref:HTH marR-type domain-containing protein n=1 Tax=Dictyobacter arantiisoli TaxID=2014874 RepID=A0A5A5TCD9_9CHLR|nr:MarR family winged helix-turn-helix transcriptional regulator [Dictyobacter arantiisoli]GCF09180.1 hypothetical protein KDI_27440 [Dictyobacter arantiisoli]
MSETHERTIITALDTYAQIANMLQRTTLPHWLTLNVSMAQLKVLFVLLQKGSTTIGKIANALDIGLPTASHLVERLVRAGLVQRREDPTDRRQMLTSLTATGQEYIDFMQSSHQAQLAHWLNLMSEDDLQAFTRSLQALIRTAHASSCASEQLTDYHLTEQIPQP